MLRYSETLQGVYSAVQTNTAPCCRGSTFCLLWGRGRLTDRHTVAAPHASAQTRCALQKEAHAVYNRGKYVSFHTRATAAIRVENQRKSIFNSFTVSHRSNRLTLFLWLCCPFCVSSRTTVAKGGKKKEKKRDMSMSVQLNLEQVVHLISTNKGRHWQIMNVSLESDQWIPALTVQLPSLVLRVRRGCGEFKRRRFSFLIWGLILRIPPDRRLPSPLPVPSWDASFERVQTKTIQL